jgi:hypothetical protein
VAEVLVAFTDAVTSEAGKNYTARACASEMPDGKWQGWIEFVPIGEGEPVRTGRETTQPNRENTMYWATGLTHVYLEGALQRAIKPLVRVPPRPITDPYFEGPAPNLVEAGSGEPGPTESVLNPFSVYRKGEALLRRQLAALSGWHLVNIIRDYRLSAVDSAALQAMPPAELVELIINAVRREVEVGAAK